VRSAPPPSVRPGGCQGGDHQKPSEGVFLVGKAHFFVDQMAKLRHAAKLECWGEHEFGCDGLKQFILLYTHTGLHGGQAGELCCSGSPLCALDDERAYDSRLLACSLSRLLFAFN
jgi:hypothetical protein